MTMSNGIVKQSESYQYILFAPKAGRFSIPGGEIYVNGKKLLSNSSTIEVVKGKTVSASPDKDKKSFVRLIASDTVAMVGQQITLEYKLYTQQDVNGYDLVNESDYDGFFSQELRKYGAQVTREILEGEEYYTKVIKQVALFPQRTGRFDLPPVVVNLAIPIPGAKRSKGFFSSIPTRLQRVSTNPLEILVTDPPPNAPVSFSGAIGKYAMTAQINKTSITTDDAFVINMEVRGTGDGKTFSAPNQPIVENMEYYDPNVIRDEDTSKDGVISNYKKIEYLIVPKKPGRYILRPEFTYYDTEKKKYVTIAPKTFKVTVNKGTRTVTNDDRNVSIAQNLMPDRVVGRELSLFSLHYIDTFWWTGMLLGLLAIGGLCFTKYRNLILENLDPEEKKRRRAQELAKSKLQKAKSYQETGDSRSFFEEISTMLNGYLGNKYGLLNTDFQKDKIIRKLSDNNVSQNMINKYLEILKTCEMALFAGQPISKMEETLQSCTDLILKLEE